MVNQTALVAILAIALTAFLGVISFASSVSVAHMLLYTFVGVVIVSLVLGPIFIRRR